MKLMPFMKIEEKYIHIGFFVFLFVILNAFFKEYVFNDISIGMVIAPLVSVIITFGVEYLTRSLKYSIWIRVGIIIVFVIFLRLYTQSITA
jgi:hypothetical protein